MQAPLTLSFQERRAMKMKAPPTSSPKSLLVATHNAGKLSEIRTLLKDLPLELQSLADWPGVAEVEETGHSFAENAALKAASYAQRTGEWTLCDDSGLEVLALDGAPGLFSARYAGEGASDAERIERLLSELAQTRDRERSARFVCVTAVSTPAGEVINLSEGECRGRIAHAPRGSHGFGYDPVFVPAGFEQTFGELPSEIKHQLSHRARALKAARRFLVKLLRDAG